MRDESKTQNEAPEAVLAYRGSRARPSDRAERMENAGGWRIWSAVGFAIFCGFSVSKGSEQDEEEGQVSVEWRRTRY